MTVRRLGRPAALLAALVMLAGVGGAVPAVTARAADQATGPLPKIWPTPQRVTARPGTVAIPAAVTGLLRGARLIPARGRRPAVRRPDPVRLRRDARRLT
jgi:hypothetical protein